MDKFEKIPVGIFDKVENNKQEFLNKFIDDLEELFPETVKDGIVDFQALLDRFGEYEEETEEKYNMTWIGKSKAIKEADEDIYGRTLKYVEEESKNPKITENLYIEGDNLEVLKLLRQSYRSKIKMIYIDPPYNRGSDLIYKDNFTMTKEEYDKLSGSIDEYGERLVKNKKDDGRYHSNWLNMIYPRLKIAKDLLKDDGFIFISIGENEVANLIKICDEIFGEKNHLNTIAVKMSEATGLKMTHSSKRLPKLKEYVLVYSKTNINTKINKISIPKDKWDEEYKYVVRGINKEELDYLKDVMENDNVIDEEIVKADDICSRIKLDSINQLYEEYNISKEDDKLNIRYLNAWRILRDVSVQGGAKDIADEKKRTTNAPFFLITTAEKKKYLIKGNYNDSASQPRIKMLFADKYLTTNPGDFWQDIKTTGLDNEGNVPYKNGKKPLKLIDRLIELSSNRNSIILDFFAGSSSTAEAVINRNNEDGGNRKYIMVQLPEDLDKSYENSIGDTKKQIKESIDFLESINKPRYLSELGKERIRRAGDMILEEAKEKGKDVSSLDIGFKVFKTMDTNLKMIKDTLEEGISMEEHKAISPKDEIDFNPHFTDIDVVYEMILRRQDITLTEEVVLLDNIGDRTYLVANTVLVCLEDTVTEEIARKIGEIDGDLSWIIMRDSAFENNINLKINTVNLLRSIVKENHKKEQKIYWI